MNGRRRLLTYLIAQEEWDFFFTVFNITDNMGHIFWTFIDPNHPNYHKPDAAIFREAFFNAYEQCDALLGELIELAGDETTTFIMSDHGFGSIYTRQYIFQRLVDGEFIRYQRDDKTSWSNFFIKQMIRIYNRFPFLREWVKGLRPQSKGRIDRTLNWAGLMPSVKTIDVHRSRILPTDFGLQMWVNSPDQFTQGFVDLNKKEQLLQDLSAYLLADRDPYTNQPIIKATYRGQEQYTGEAAAAGPDLIIEFNNFNCPDVEPARINPNLEGGHTQDGVFLAYGPGIKNKQITEASLIDLAPMILHMLDEPIPPDMDGQVLIDILVPERQEIRAGQETAVHKIENEQIGYNNEEEAELLDQLRQLGYVD